MAMTTASERAGLASLRSPSPAAVQRLRDYVTLTKSHVNGLLLVTTVASMVVAAGGWPGGAAVLLTVTGGYLMAGSANATNMYLDRDIDARMTRTCLRPIPSGRMSPRHGLAYAMVLGAVALVVLYAGVNPLSAGLALCGWVWYVGVYTLGMKRTSPHACVIGGAAGAVPPVVGWAAVTGGLSATALLLFLIVFLWTPPHFWALALAKRTEYGRAGMPMAPNVWGEKETLRQMRIYTLALVPLSLAPVVLTGDLGPVYAALALGLGGWFAWSVARIGRAEDVTRPAWSAYGVSLLYLALLFGSMALDAVLVGAASATGR